MYIYTKFRKQKTQAKYEMLNNAQYNQGHVIFTVRKILIHYVIYTTLHPP